MKIVRVALAIVVIASAGCSALDEGLRQRIESEAAGLTPAVDDDRAVVRVASEVAESGGPLPAATPLPSRARLGDYIRVALRDNPSIRRTVRQVQALGYRVPQVTSLDDPMIALVPPTGDMTQTAGGEVAGAVGASQKIPFPGKLATRGRLAEAAVRMALQSLADTRISVVAQVQKAYYSYYLAVASIRINRESERLVRQIRAVAAARYRTGAATQQDVLRAEVELYALTNELITLNQQRTTAVALLNSLMNRRVDAPLPPPEPFDLARVEWLLPRAMAQAVRSSPRLARLQAQIERDLEAIKLARLDYYPDLTAGLVYTFISAAGLSPVAGGKDVWNLGLGLNLPIWWQRLRARVLETNARALASVESYEEARNLLFFQIQDKLVQIDTRYRQGVLHRDLLVPRAWQTVEVSTSAYRAGKLEFTALIDNWRKWLDFALAYEQALAGLEQAFADLQQLLGVRVARRPRAASGAPR